MASVTKKFRKDINGLRAIAVLGVLLFHLFAYLEYSGIVSVHGLFSGGYVGVDVFFVISGFLMTAIIVGRMQNCKFSLWMFWKKRAARICPALLFLVICVLVAGYFVQPADVYTKTARESLRALLFISNFWFARDEGYFATAVLDKTLLHTWSLSVEWQFYLLYPLLLMAVLKLFGIKAIGRFILGLFVVCFILTFVLPAKDSMYFMLHARAWELLIGGVVYVLPSLKLKPAAARVIEIATLLGILANMAFTSPMEGWEPLKVLPGVFCTALVIWVNVENSALSNSCFQFLGKISYSLYLIHWPVIVTFAKLNLLHSYILLLAIILLYAIFSYYVVEVQRRGRIAGVTILGVYIATVPLSQMVVSCDGFENRMSESYWLSNFGGQGFGGDGNLVSGRAPGQPLMFLAGDSFSAHYTDYFNKTIPFVDLWNSGTLLFWHLTDLYSKEPQTAEERFRATFLKFLSEDKTDKVVLAQSWLNYLNLYTSMHTELKPKSGPKRAAKRPESKIFSKTHSLIFRSDMTNYSLAS